jgi:hypothetical protein
MNDVISLALFYKFHESKNSMLLELDVEEWTYNVLLELQPNEWMYDVQHDVSSAWDKAYVFHVASDLEDQPDELAKLLRELFKTRRPTTLYLLFADRAIQLDLRTVKHFSLILASDKNKTIYL